MRRPLLIVAMFSPLVTSCATQMVEQQAKDSCAKKGKTAFITEMSHSGVPLLIDSASAHVLCFGADAVTHLPPAFGADAISIGDPQGAGIVAVTTGAVAHKAGLRIYDVVFDVGGRPINGATELRTALQGLAPDSQAPIKLHRGSKDLTLNVRF